MEFDKTLTPEKQWNKIKKLAFKDGVPHHQPYTSFRI